MAKIMVVDDTDEARILMRKRLKAAGYEVAEFAAAAPALAAMAETRPDLILMDVNMPEMGGMEACRLLTDAHPGVPVIFLTAQGDADIKVQGLDAGGRDYVVKGTPAAELLARIKSALREKAARNEAEKRAETFKVMAITDALTGLANRRYFELRVGEEQARAERYGLELTCLMIDIDRFKSINDTYGHGVGDMVIAEVARVIRDNTRTVDIAARYGGEEFVVILPETGLDRAVTIGERIRDTVEKMDLGEGKPRVTTSVGVASGIGADLVENADKALYEAKRGGRNRVEKRTHQVPQTQS